KRDAFRKAHSSTRTSRPGERAGGFAGVFAAGAGAVVFAAGVGAGAAAAGVPPFGLASGRSIVRVPAATPSAPGAGGSGGSAVPIGSDAARNRSSDSPARRRGFWGSAAPAAKNRRSQATDFLSS